MTHFKLRFPLWHLRYGLDDVLVLAGLAIGSAIVGMTLGFGILRLGLDFFGQLAAVALRQRPSRFEHWQVDAVDGLAASRS